MWKSSTFFMSNKDCIHDLLVILSTSCLFVSQEFYKRILLGKKGGRGEGEEVRVEARAVEGGKVEKKE